MKYPNDLEFSFDLEASGLLHEVSNNRPYMLEIGIVPFSVSKGRVYTERGLTILIKCPDLETMKKDNKISDFVLSDPNLLALAIECNKVGVSISEAKKEILAYVESFKCEVNGNRLPIVSLSKSATGLDRELMNIHFGHLWVENTFSYKTKDVTSCESFVIESGGLSKADAKKIKKRLELDGIKHRAHHDAIKEARFYIEICKVAKELFRAASKNFIAS